MSFDDGENQFPEDAAGHRDCRMEIDQLRKELAESEAQREAMRAKVWEEAAKCVPYSWLDELLSGPEAANVTPGPEVAKLLDGIRKRMKAKAQEERGNNAK